MAAVELKSVDRDVRASVATAVLDESFSHGDVKLRKIALFDDTFHIAAREWDGHALRGHTRRRNSATGGKRIIDFGARRSIN